MSERRSKYNATPIDADGYTFDSKAEERRYQELKILWRNGDITALEIHPTFELIPAFKYKGKTVRAVMYEADFSYIEHNKIIVEDVKGVRTAAFNLKWKMMQRNFGYLYDLRIVGTKRTERHRNGDSRLDG